MITSPLNNLALQALRSVGRVPDAVAEHMGRQARHAHDIMQNASMQEARSRNELEAAFRR